jgi:hypothetical protein
MVIRLHNVTKWDVLQPGQVLQLPGDDGHARKIRLEVNCPSPTRFDIMSDGTMCFLAVVEGLETLEFTGSGTVEVSATADSEVWYFTHDGTDSAVEIEDAKSFVKIANRRTRNPQQELMMFKLEQNMKRREAAQAEELAQMRELLAARKAEEEAHEPAPPADSPAASPAPAGGKPKAKAVPPEPAGEGAAADDAT